MSAHDVAIYLPFSSGFYSKGFGRGGGAERQMMLLARSLAKRGVRVAHIVYPVDDPVDLPPGLDLVPRSTYAGRRRLVGGILEGVHIMRSLEAADARVVVVRTGTPVVGLVALYCRVRRRRLIFSAANDSDFLPEKHAGRRVKRALYRLGLRLAHGVVVQSADQLELARATHPWLRNVTWIPSLADDVEVTAPAVAPTDFIWVGRLYDHKQPLDFPRLAAAMPEARFLMVATIVPGYGRIAAETLVALRQAGERLPNFELVEPMHHARLVELIGSSVALVATSGLEGMPNVFLEAWSCGVPVLTLNFDPDGIVERHGLGVAAGGDWDRFHSGAQELWRSRLDRAEMSARSQAYVRETHSIDAVTQRWEALLKEVGQ